jgi:hypothetical protein
MTVYRMTRTATALLLLALGACQVTDLQKLQSTETTLLQARNAEAAGLPAEGDAPDFTLDPNLQRQNLDTAFGTLAADAFALAESWTSDPRTQVTAYRIAATAAWQSHDADKRKILDTAQPKAEELCNDLKPGAEGAPGNCAYVAFIPIFTAYESTTETIARLEKSHSYSKDATENVLNAIGNMEAMVNRETNYLPKFIAGTPPFAGLYPLDIDQVYKRRTVLTGCLMKLTWIYGNNAAANGDEPDAKTNGAAIRDRIMAMKADYLPLFKIARVDNAPDLQEGATWMQSIGPCPTT